MAKTYYKMKQHLFLLGVLSIVTLVSALPAYALSDAMEDDQYPSPLEQYNAGTALHEIRCNEPRDLYVTGSDMPVCLYSDTYEMLLNRGVSLSLPPTSESVVRGVVNDTIAMYESDPDGAFATITAMMSTDPWYPFIGDSTAHLVAHGSNPDLIGDDIRVLIKYDMPLETFISELQEGEFWYEYTFHNPATGTEQHKRALFVLHDGHVFGSGYYTTPESIARGVVNDTIALYDSDPDGAFATINAMMSSDPSYPFVIDSDSIIVAHGSNPDRVGVDSTLIASTNKPVDVIISELQEGEVWVEYVFNNPATGTEQHKRSLIMLHDGYIFGSGYYAASEDVMTDAMSSLELTAEETAWLEENGTIRVAFDPGWLPIEYADESGNLAGVTLQYTAEFSKLTGADFAGIPAAASWNDALAIMQNGDADVMYMIASTPDRLEYLDFTTTHYTVEARIASSEDRQFTMEDEDLKLVTVTGYAIESWLDENHPDLEYTSVGNFAEGLELMKTGEANAFAATWQIIVSHAETAGINVYDAGPTGYSYNMHVGYSNQNPILGSILQKVVDHIPASQIAQWWSDAVPAEPSLELTAEETAWLEENGTIRVAFDPGWLPIEYADESGNLAGVTLQYTAEFSKLTGADFAGIPAAASWNDALAIMQNGDADVMYMIASTPDRLEYLDFTTTHYTVEARIASSEDRQFTMEDEDLKLVTVTGYAIESWLDENHPDLEYTSVGNFAEGLELMKTGEANAFAATWQIIVSHAETAGINVYDAGPTGYSYNMHVGYSNQNPILGSILQKVVDHIPASQIAQWWSDAVPAEPSLELTAEETAWLEENGTIRVAFDPGWLPIEYADESGNLAGVTLQYTAEFSKLTGADFAGIPAAASWNDALAIMQNGDADVMYMIASTPDRLEYLDFTTTHYTVEARIASSEDRQFTREDEDLKLVTVTGYAIESWLDENHPDLEYTSVGNFAEGLELMKTGEANAFAATWQIIVSHAETAGINVYDAGPTGYSYNMHVGYSNQNPILGSILQKVVDHIPASQIAQWWSDAVPAEPSLELTAEETAWLEENGTIRVSYNSGWTPIEYADDEGNLAGITLEYAKDFSKLTGADFVEAQSASAWSDVAEMIRDDNADVMFSVISLPERAEYMNYTSIHYAIDARMVTTDDRQISMDDPNLQLVSIRGYDIAFWLDEFHPNVEYVLVDGFDEAFEMLSAGNADALVATWPVASYHAAQAGVDVYDAGSTGYQYELRVGYSNQNPILGSILQKAVDHIPASQIEQLWNDAV